MKMHLGLPLCLALTLSLAAPSSLQAQEAAPAHGMAMHGDLKYGPDFEHFDYVNPNAPKGGTVTFSVIGTFDSLNPYIIRGTAAAGITLALREPDHAVAGRAVLRVRPARRIDRDAGGPLLGSLHAAARKRAGTTASRSRSRT